MSWAAVGKFAKAVGKNALNNMGLGFVSPALFGQGEKGRGLWNGGLVGLIGQKVLGKKPPAGGSTTPANTGTDIKTTGTDGKKPTTETKVATEGDTEGTAPTVVTPQASGGTPVAAMPIQTGLLNLNPYQMNQENDLGLRRRYPMFGQYNGNS